MKLRDLLMVSSDVRVGYGVNDSAVFYSRPGWIADTLALIPYPWEIVFAGDSSSIPPGFAKALTSRRAEFNRIGAAGGGPFPNSSGAKYAVAISLELLGDPTAIDTIRLARNLARDPGRKAHLAAAEVLMLMKFGIPDDTVRLKSARMLSDSLLSTEATKQSDEAEDLAPLAAMSGRCSQMDQLVRLAVPAAGYQRIPAAIIADANVLVTRIAMGCSVDAKAIRLLSSELSKNFAGRKEDDLRRAEQMLLYRSVMLAPSLDPAVTDRVAGGRGTDLLTALYAFLHKDRAGTRDGLVAMEKKVDPGMPTPDITLSRARLWVSLGDRGRAARTLDAALRQFDPTIRK